MVIVWYVDVCIRQRFHVKGHSNSILVFQRENLKPDTTTIRRASDIHTIKMIVNSLNISGISKKEQKHFQSNGPLLRNAMLGGRHPGSAIYALMKSY